MVYNLDSEIDRHKAQDRFKQLLIKRVVIEIKEKKARSTSQNSYLHLLLGHFALEYGCTLEESKDIYKQVNDDLYPIQYRENLIGSKRYVTEKRRSSADLDSKEMTESIDKFRNWSQIEAGIYLPSPDDKRFLIEVDVQMTKNREFL